VNHIHGTIQVSSGDRQTCFTLQIPFEPRSEQGTGQNLWS
jgi:hypothetical protein